VCIIVEGNRSTHLHWSFVAMDRAGDGRETAIAESSSP
jgi:hypothetical protein